jgi:cytochrome c-type biogenesis protein CcmF
VDRLGTFALLVSLALAVYGLVASVVGARRGRPLLIESARTTAFSLFAIVAAANAAMLAAILSNDFAVSYVAQNSSRETPTFFKILALWSNDEGSLLLWNLILAGFIAAVAFRFRKGRPAMVPWALAVLYGVQVFYLVLVMGPTRPFARLSVAPPDGQGPLPLLQNHPLMAIHPPMLYLGFIGTTVPFAFAIASLLAGTSSDAWVRITRRWALAAWIFLTVGLFLGGLWSYGVLGWGGYWAWDPVENVALLPWLVTTAFLHSVMLQERRGMLRVWNVSLCVGAFALATFGTFLTRGSILASVHAFAKSAVGPMYLGFLLLVLAGGFGLIAWRSWRLASEGRFDAVLSREAAFLGNNLLLLVITLIVLTGTIYPLFVEALTNQQVTVGGPYFDRTVTPVFLLLLFLVGVGPLLPWRRGSAERLRRRAAMPAIVGAVVVVALAVAGIRHVVALLAYGLAAFVIASNLELIVASVLAFRRATGRRGPSSVVASMGRNRRATGGYTAHVGLAILAIAITTSATFGLQTEVTLARGQRVAFAGAVLRYDGATTVQQAQRRVFVAHVTVLRDGRPAGVLHPSLNVYPAQPTEPIGTPSIHYGVLKDLYSSVLGFDGSKATLRFFLNPGVMWLWIGAGIMALGGLLAAWPARRRRADLPPADAADVQSATTSPDRAVVLVSPEASPGTA